MDSKSVEDGSVDLCEQPSLRPQEMRKERSGNLCQYFGLTRFAYETTREQDREARMIMQEMLGERWRYSWGNSTCQQFSYEMFDFFHKNFPEAYRPFPWPEAEPQKANFNGNIGGAW